MNDGTANDKLANTRIASKCKVRFIDLLRPENMDWLGKPGAQTAFGVLAWMVETSRHYVKSFSPGPLEDINGQPSVLSYNHCLTIGRKWRDQLRDMFRWCLLSGWDYATRERKRAERIALDNHRVLPIRRRIRDESTSWPGYPECMDDEIDELFGLAGNTLNTSFNEIYPDATHLNYLKIKLYGLDNWVVCLNYGIKGDSSGWELEFANTEGEIFFDFILRVLDEIKGLVRLEEQP